VVAYGAKVVRAARNLDKARIATEIVRDAANGAHDWSNSTSSH
jgi:hypothetical protein